MRYFKTTALIVLVSFHIVRAQKYDSTSVSPLFDRVVFTTTARILPFFSIGIGTYFIPYGTQVPEYRGHFFINIKDIGELSINNEELLSDYDGLFLRSPIASDIKLKLLSESELMPATSLSFHNMFGWQYQEYELFGDHNDRPDLRAKGFSQARFNYQILAINLMAAKRITDELLFSIGMGIRSLQIKDITMFTSATPYRYDKLGITQTILPYGYINGQYAINNLWTIFVEAQNFPTLTPDVDKKDIQIGQSYMFALGGRLSIADGVGLNIFVRRVESFVGSSSSDVVLGLNFALPNQALKLTK